MSRSSPVNHAGRKVATATIAALILLAPMPAAMAAIAGLPLQSTPVSNSITAVIGAPADESEFPLNSTVQFTDASTHNNCPITSWRWTFGDGTNSTQRNPTKTYTTPGSFVVALQVRSSSCTTLVSTTSIDVHILPIAPTATISGPTSGVAGEELTFVATGEDSDGTVVGFVFYLDGAAQPQQVSDTFLATFTAAGEHVVGVSSVDNHGALSEPATVGVTIAAGPLSYIVVHAPATVAAGSTLTIDATGHDEFGNEVPLVVSSFEHTFQSTTGLETVCHTDQDVTGCADVQVFAEGLDRIEVSGPSSMVVNTTAVFTFVGYDAFNNSVPLETSEANYTAPTAAGLQQVCHTEQDVTGCADVSVLPDVAVSMEILGPDQVLVNSTTIYEVSALDQFNNSALLTNYTVSFVAPATPQMVDVCYTETETTPEPLTACKEVSVLAALLDRIDIAGPDTMVVNTTAVFYPTGYDAYNNTVELMVTQFNHTSGTLAGPASVCYAEGGVQGCKTIEVLPGPHVAIQILGADQIVVNTSGTYDVKGLDKFGNNVTLSIPNLTVVAPTTVGTIEVSHTEDGITGNKTVQVIADALASITVEGPTSLVANTTGTYTADGFDQLGNAVALAADTFEFNAPAEAGPTQACYEEDGIMGCQPVEIVADALFVIEVSGPDTVVAGSTTEFALSGVDQYGNEVALENTTLSFTAPTAIGAANVCYEESDVSGCKLVDVIVDTLAKIVVSGPDALTVGTTGVFYHVGLDQFDNVVDLDVIAQSFTAPTTAGTASVCHTESDVTGCKLVQILGGPAVSISVSGPTQMFAGSTAQFSVSGTDVYGNAATLGASSFAFTAPSALGIVQACFTENGVTGCQAVEVVTNPLASILVSGPATVVAGASANFTLAGRDASGNETPISKTTLVYTAPRAFGPAPVCYTENNVQGCLTIIVVPSRINVTGPAKINLGRPTQISALGFDVDDQPVVGGSFAWSATRGGITSSGVYTALTVGVAQVTASIGGVSGSTSITNVNTLLLTTSFAVAHSLGSDVRGTVLVQYVDGTPVANANVQLVFQNSFLDPIGRTTQNVQTDASGTAQIDPPTQYEVPGQYRISVLAARNNNQGTTNILYSVGA